MNRQLRQQECSEKGSLYAGIVYCDDHVGLFFHCAERRCHSLDERDRTRGCDKKNGYGDGQVLKYAVGGYFKAQFKIMGIVFLILLVGLGFLKIHYFVLIAFLIAFLDFLPFFGTEL